MLDHSYLYISTTKAIGHPANKTRASVFQMQVMAEFTHTIGFTFTAFHAFSVTNQNPLMSVEEARQLLSKAEMRKAIADEAIDEITNDHDPSEKLDNLKFYSDHFVTELVEALADGSVVIHEVETEKS
ncbi:hypothetical protein sync_1060 [Synechococcus sp. CC9311]|nr:hypothetical protein sync_1060 [Synechococcus sp. CC9311]